MSTIGQWTDLEGHVGLWCGCFPAMQPILRSFLSSIGASRLLSSNKLSRTGGDAYGNKSGNNNKSNNNMGSRGWNRSNAIPLSSRPHGDLDDCGGEDNISQKGIIRGDFELSELEDGKGGGGGAGRGEIVKNTRVQISYEQRDSSSEDIGKADAWSGGRAA